MFKFRPGTIPTNIFVVGCGGTGSRLVPALVQFIRSITKEHNPTGWLGATNIVLIDGDIVEQKNLLRQNFIANDVNKNKAAVLAMRYSRAYDMNVVAYPKFIEKGAKPTALRGDIQNATGIVIDQNSNDMVIMCVDSAEARRTVLAGLGPVNNNKRTVFIDAGNEDSFGQVRMFTNDIFMRDYTTDEEYKAKYKKPERIAFSPEPYNFIPYDADFYRNLQDNPGLGSCADLDQTLAINSLMAMHILAFVQNYYYNKVIDYHQISIDIGTGAAYYTKNDITTYRNTALKYDDPITGKIGAGQSYGFEGVCSYRSAPDYFDHFISNNAREVKKIEDAMKAALEKPVEVVVSAEDKPKAKKAKKKVEEVVAPMPIEAVPFVPFPTVETDYELDEWIEVDSE